MDLHAWITQQVDRARLVALDATPHNWRDESSPEHGFRVGTADGAAWVAFTGDHDDDPKQSAADAQHIALHDSAAVLRRCEADRRILARHLPQPDGTPFPDGQQCRTCSEDGGDGYQYLVPYPCPTITDLAHAHGITDGILAGLDRPQPPEAKRATGRLGLADILATPPITTSDVPEALRGPHWKP